MCSSCGLPVRIGSFRIGLNFSRTTDLHAWMSVFVPLCPCQMLSPLRLRERSEYSHPLLRFPKQTALKSACCRFGARFVLAPLQQRSYQWCWRKGLQQGKQLAHCGCSSSRGVPQEGPHSVQKVCLALRQGLEARGGRGSLSGTVGGGGERQEAVNQTCDYGQRGMTPIELLGKNGHSILLAVLG